RTLCRRANQCYAHPPRLHAPIPSRTSLIIPLSLSTPARIGRPPPWSAGVPPDGIGGLCAALAGVAQADDLIYSMALPIGLGGVERDTAGVHSRKRRDMHG